MRKFKFPKLTTRLKCWRCHKRRECMVGVGVQFPVDTGRDWEKVTLPPLLCIPCVTSIRQYVSIVDK